MHSELLFKEGNLETYARFDLALVKPYIFIVRCTFIDKDCRLYCEIINDMSSSFEPNEVYETIASKLTREFPGIGTKEGIAKILANFNLIERARDYTLRNDEHIEKIKFY